MQSFLITYHIVGGASVTETFEAVDLAGAAEHADGNLVYDRRDETFEFMANPGVPFPTFTKVRREAVTHYTIVLA